MLFSSIVSIIAIAGSVSSAPAPLAVPEAFPGALGLALAANDPASYQCHADCGNLIYAARKCTPGGKSDTGPWDNKCLCESGSEFSKLVDSCLECGWCLWKDYAKYLTAPLSTCSKPAVPTGVTCAPAATA